MPDDGITRRPRGRPRTQGFESGAGTVQALDRGLTLLTMLAREGDATLNELALMAGMPPSTAHRLLVTLQNAGFAGYDMQSQQWSIGVEAFRVGSAYLHRTNLVESSRAIMHALMESTGETANLAIMDNGDVVFISQVESHNAIRAFFRPGVRSHMHASGIGKALLSFLPQQAVEKILHDKGLPQFTTNTLISPQSLFKALEATRKQGWALDDEEHHIGMRCVAAPIFNAFGEAIAGLSVSGPSVRLPDDRISETGALVRQAADEVTELVAGVRPS